MTRSGISKRSYKSEHREKALDKVVVAIDELQEHLRSLVVTPVESHTSRLCEIHDTSLNDLALRFKDEVESRIMRVDPTFVQSLAQCLVSYRPRNAFDSEDDYSAMLPFDSTFYQTFQASPEDFDFSLRDRFGLGDKRVREIGYRRWWNRIVDLTNAIQQSWGNVVDVAVSDSRGDVWFYTGLEEDELKKFRNVSSRPEHNLPEDIPVTDTNALYLSACRRCMDKRRPVVDVSWYDGWVIQVAYPLIHKSLTGCVVFFVRPNLAMAYSPASDPLISEASARAPFSAQERVERRPRGTVFVSRKS